MKKNIKQHQSLNDKKYAKNWRNMAKNAAEKFCQTKDRTYLKQMVFCHIRYLLIVGPRRKTKDYKESAILFCKDWDVIVEGVSLLTPREFVTMFPITKRYDNTLSNNDYFKTINAIENMFNWDEPIYCYKGRKVSHKVAGSTFLSIYFNAYIGILFTGMMVNLGYLNVYYSDVNNSNFYKNNVKKKIKIPDYLKVIK